MDGIAVGAIGVKRHFGRFDFDAVQCGYERGSQPIIWRMKEDGSA